MRAPATVAFAFAALIGLSACASPSGSPSPGGFGAGSAEPIAVSACPAIELRAPSGELLLLTGRWRSPDGATYYLRQNASCVWITGFSRGTGAPGGEGTTEFTNAFFGRLESDFTMSGLWADMPWGREEGAGSVTFQIEFTNIGGVEATSFRVIEVTGGVELFLVRPESDAELRVRLRENDTGPAGPAPQWWCGIVVSDEPETYELFVADPEWSLLRTGQLVARNGTVIHPGEPFEVSGEIARGVGACDSGLIVIADHIEASTP